ncbi:hypothetical protein WAF17_07850 [Bernardetia sp. ABR2-2B]|uniref:hypothetical protein n=1 Tax=Bernardetia sp. ABR2-2B TaxID=3127472 RepID=UPI0030D32D3A
MKSIIYLSLITLCSIFLLGCNPDKDKRVSASETKNSTTQNSVLFFKNTRSLDYNKKDEPKLKREIYTHEDASEDTLKPVLNMTIVYLWDKDKAYIITDPNKYIEDYFDESKNDTLKIRWKNPKTEAQGTLFYIAGHVDTQYEFATQLYNSLLDKYEFYMLPNEIPILDTKKERETFRITMMDYYRLVGVFK